MAKQKEIKFRRDGKLFYGQQNGVKYSIHEARRLHEDESEQYYVSVNYSSISLPPAVTGSCRLTSPTSMPVAFAGRCSKKKMRTEVPNEHPS